MRKSLLYLMYSLLLLGALPLAACTRYVHPDPTSELAKLRVGMSQNQVFDLVGMPTDTKIVTRYGAMLGYLPFFMVTGGFIGFIGQPDSSELHYYYPRLGRVYLHDSFRFASGANPKVVKVIFDQEEDGYQ